MSTGAKIKGIKNTIVGNAKYLGRALNSIRHLSKLSDNEGDFMDNSDKINPAHLKITQIESLEQDQKALKELENIYSSAYVGLCVLDKELRYVRINDRLAEMNGIPATGHIGRTVREIIPSIADQAEELARRVFASGKPELDVEFPGTTQGHEDKERCWISHWLPMTDHTGAVIAINVVTHEITERKRSEEILHQSYDELRAIYNGMPEGLLIADAETKRFIKTNPAMCQMLGYSEDELLSMSVKDIHPITALPSVLSQFRAGMEGQLELAEDVPLLRRDGTIFYADVKINHLTYNGRFCLMGFFHDLTRRMQNLDAIRQSQADLKRAQEVGQMGWWRLDTRRNILMWSDESYRICGIPKGTPQTYETFLKIVHPDDRSYVDKKWKATLRGEPYDIEHRIVVGGRVKWLREKAFLENDDEGNLLGGFGIAQDITQRKEMEEALKQSRDELEMRVQERTRELSSTIDKLQERSNQLRRITAELARAEQQERQRLAQMLHDGLQQMLVGASLQIEYIRHSENISDELDRLKKILDEASDASRSLAMELSPPILLRRDFPRALKWLADWMRDTHGLNVDLKYPEDMPPLAEEILLVLFQSIRELLFNIVKHAEVRQASLELNQQDGQIQITVEDKGAGFDTDKLLAKGEESEGFGLSSIRERLSLMGGKIEIDSGVGQGSLIRLTAPLSLVTTVTDQTSIIEQTPIRSFVQKQKSSKPRKK